MGAVEAGLGSGDEAGEDDGWAEALRGQLDEELQQEDDELFDDVFDHERDSGDVIVGDEAEYELFGPDSDEEPAVDGEEGHKAKGRVSQKLPSQEEVDIHEMAHAPYRSWCIHCRRCKARMDYHKGKKAQEKFEDNNSAVSTWSIDYSYFTTQGIAIKHKDRNAVQEA